MTTPSDLTRLAMVRLNSTFAIPASPAMIVSRMSSEGLVWTPNVVESPELNTSGQLGDSMLASSSSAGPIEFPLIRTPWFHEMLAAVFRNDWATGTIGDDSVTPGVYVTRAASANELVPGKNVFLYGVEKKFQPDNGGSAAYHLYDRVGVASLGLRVQPGELVTGSAQLMGSGVTFGSTGIASATYPDPGAYLPFTAPNVTQVTIAGLSASQCFNQLSLNFNSNLRSIPCIGLESDKTKGLGRFIPMIEGTTYFETNEHVAALKAQSFLKVTVALTDGSGNSYTFFFPRCKFVTAPVATPGTNQDVMQPVSLRAHYDPNYLFSCKVTRVLAP